MRTAATATLLLVRLLLASGLQNLFPKNPFQVPSFASSGKNAVNVRQLEDDLLGAIAQTGNRLSNSDDIAALIQQLEDNKQQSIPNPAISPEVYGRWRLVYTTNAATSSPIQRKAVDTSKFPIYQDIVVNDKGQLQVNQVVKFSENAYLSVDALASTAAYPLDSVLATPRKGTGKILGFNVLGVSIVGEEAAPDPERPDSRINFVFDQGNFQFGDDIRIPYPVPFRLPILRDAVKGWIDITWLSDRLRIAKGNKGTKFVLVKEEEQL